MFSFFRRRNTGRAPQRHTAPQCRPTLEALEDRALMDASLPALAVIGNGGDGGGEEPPPIVFTAPVGQSGKVFLTATFATVFETHFVYATEQITLEQITFRYGDLTVTYKSQEVHNENGLAFQEAKFLSAGFGTDTTIGSIPGAPGLLVAADLYFLPHSQGT